MLSVQVTGSPLPDICWLKDGRELQNNSRIKISKLPNGVSSLFINNAMLDDEGAYQIIANNEHGVSVYHANIIVEGTYFLNILYT